MDKKKIRIEWRAQILGVAFLTLISCGPAQKDNKDTEEVPVAQQPKAEPVAVEEDASTVQTSVQTPAQEAAAIKLNPPHGEPGHRCEIPVGSPLNAPAAVEAPTSVTTPAPPATQAARTYSSMAPTVENARRLNATQGNQTAAPPTGEKPKLNPPHGQPWHRCDIAVGSPLS